MSDQDPRDFAAELAGYPIDERVSVAEKIAEREGSHAAAHWIAATVAHFDRDLERIEVLENDGRHGIGYPWLVVRGWTRGVPAPTPGRVYIGKKRTPRLRRLYAHPSGYLAEGGRGGARLFFVARDAAPAPFGALDSACTVARARSIRFAAEIVGALAGEEG